MQEKDRRTHTMAGMKTCTRRVNKQKGMKKAPSLAKQNKIARMKIILNIASERYWSNVSKEKT